MSDLIAEIINNNNTAIKDLNLTCTFRVFQVKK